MSHFDSNETKVDRPLRPLVPEGQPLAEQARRIRRALAARGK